MVRQLTAGRTPTAGSVADLRNRQLSCVGRKDQPIGKLDRRASARVGHRRAKTSQPCVAIVNMSATGLIYPGVKAATDLP